MQKTIETAMGRKFTIRDDYASGAVILDVEKTDGAGLVVSRLIPPIAIDLGEAIIQAAGREAFVYEGRLPIIRDGKNGEGYFDRETGITRYASEATPDSLMKEIKALIAIRGQLIKDDDERRARRAEEALAELKLKGRRDALVKKLTGCDNRTYRESSEILKKAIDYAIELEDQLSDHK
jgi:hypothetical protein